MKKLVFGLIATVMFSITGTAQEYKNKSNPFDNRGEIHNQIMKDLLAKGLSNDLEIEAVINEITKIIKANPTYLKTVGSENLNFDSNFVTQAANDYSQKYQNIIRNSDLSATGKSFATQLIDYTFDPNVTYEGFLVKVKAVETKIAASSMEESEKEVLLTAASVARHSAQLWIVNKALDGKASFTGSSLRPKKGRGWIVVGADVLGACVGGFAGAAYGSGCAYYITGAFKE